MRYKQCRQCGFWVTVQETYCPNCGIISPQRFLAIPPKPENSLYQKNNDQGSSVIFIGSSLGVILGALSAWIIRGILGIEELVFYIAMTVGGGIAGFISSASILLVKKMVHKYRAIKLMQRRSSSCLRQNEDVINQRLDEIQAKEDKIKALILSISQETRTERSQKILESLKNGMAVLHGQQELYNTKLWELDLVRWHNSLKPLINALNNLTHKKCEQLLESLTTIQQTGESLLQKWQTEQFASTSEGDNCVHRLQRALEACKQIREDIRAKQSALVLKGISPLEKEALTTTLSYEALEEVDLFNALPDVDMFSSGFKDLEEEYFRLQSEEEISRDFNI